MTSTRKILACAAVAVLTVAAAAMPSSTTQFATDAYPGFDSEAGILATPQKETGFFWWCGPKMDNPKDQLAWAKACEADGSIGKARKAYDALVAEWPTSPEAAPAQLALAELEYGKAFDYIQAFAEYKYLLDFFSTQCDYDAIIRRLYETAKMMRQEGKRIVFFRFANTTDVRRAFEAVVRRAPGASFAPEAMLTIAELRQEEGEDEKAIEVYETLRNLHAGSTEAKLALGYEAKVRVKVLKEHTYNRSRCQDTVSFLKLALAQNPDPALKADLSSWLSEAVSLLEDEAFAAARFYDSRTRTRRSAISAYERFLNEYPASRHADEARARLRELQEAGQ